MPSEQDPTPPGWYPDPVQAGRMRWWDGARWTGRVLQRERGPLERGPVADTEPPPEGTPPPAPRGGPPTWVLALIVLAVVIAVALALALLAGST